LSQEPAQAPAPSVPDRLSLCHLEGVHGGRFTVTREGPSLVWRFGKHTVVVDRDRYRTG
jgi:hypothetical protein